VNSINELTLVYTTISWARQGVVANSGSTGWQRRREEFWENERTRRRDETERPGKAEKLGQWIVDRDAVSQINLNNDPLVVGHFCYRLFRSIVSRISSLKGGEYDNWS
jgi:hypothetical protein